MHKLQTVCPNPNCRTLQPLIAAVDGDEQPTKGDRVMCFKCGRWALYDPDVIGRLKKPTGRELLQIAHDPDCREMAWLWAMHA